MALPTRHDRLLDILALTTLVLAVALYADGNARLRRIQLFTAKNRAPMGVSQLDMADRARYEANAGIALAALGCVAGAAHAVRVKRRLPIPALS